MHRLQPLYTDYTIHYGCIKANKFFLKKITHSLRGVDKGVGWGVTEASDLVPPLNPPTTRMGVGVRAANGTKDTCQNKLESSAVQ